MKTPDEIKKALAFGKDNCLFVNGDCKDCAYGKECSTYDSDSMADLPRAMISDALAYIQQLEDERDAAVSELVGCCPVCRWQDTEKCDSCHFNEDAWNVHESNWEWRGVQKEE